MAEPSSFWFWILTLALAAVGGGWLSLRWLKVARMLEDTPTSRIRSAAQGYVELSGRCRAMGGAQNPAPLTLRPCVWWRYRIEQKKQSGGSGRDSWTTINSGRSELPFLLEDGTGECIVQPSGAEVLTDESTTWYGSTPWPTQAAGAGLLHFQEQGYRYFEERVYEHEQLCLLGKFSSHATTADGDRDAEVATLLAEWKDDQAALTERFDGDHDGRVSMGEWERAREEARRTVVERESERPPTPALHVLGRPDGGQLFLIAAFPEKTVAKRYRRRAILAFAGFLAATFALGSLLQGALR